VNYAYAIRVSAVSLLVVVAAIAAVGVWAVIEAWQAIPGQGEAARALGVTCLLGVGCVGTVLLTIQPPDAAFGRREALLMVGLTWVIAPALSAMPYYLWAQWFYEGRAVDHPFRSFVNCYFEATSGLTTTGASILSDIESVPRGLLLWRSLTHWLGGLGIVLLFVALLPMVGAVGRKLYAFEATGPSRTASQPQIRELARVLWLTYAVLTLGGVVALRLAGLPWFHAVCESFGSIATGGFSVRNASIAAYHLPLVEAIVVALMVLGAVNFSLYYQIIRGRFETVFRDPELRLLLVLLGFGSLLVAATLVGKDVRTLDGRTLEAHWFDALRYGVFNLVSMHTDTGYATADFDAWPVPAAAIIVLGTFIGGSAGSTTGGIKIVRVLALGKIVVRELHAFVRPTLVEPVRLGRRVLDPDDQTSLLVTVLLFVAALVCGTVALMMFGVSERAVNVRTAFSASLAALCTAGPGFGGVGPTANYNWLPSPSKAVLSALMLIGRLEIVSVLVLFQPSFWRAK